MKKSLLIAISCLMLFGCSSSHEVLFQVSTIDALLAGVYDGEVTQKELLRHGDQGIGTFDGLDGEMTVVDGTVYQIKADGHVYKPALDVKTPFASVSEFRSDAAFVIEEEVDYDVLKQEIDNYISNKNLFYALRISGDFEYVRTRSVPKQQKPYPPLKEVTKNQPEFEMKNISGVLVGFWCPKFAKGLNVTGYHLHFLDESKSKGGHLLEVKAKKVKCEIDVYDRFVVDLPGADAGFAGTDLSMDRTKELEVVEQ